MALTADLYYLGQHEEALRLLGEAEAILVDVLGPSHPDVAAVLSHVGVIYGDLGDVARAEPAARRSLEIRRRSLGADNPLTLVSAQNLASILLAAGRLDDALPLMTAALAAGERLYGNDHMELTWTLRDLGELEYRRGRLGEAEAYLGRALAIRERERGLDHPEVAVVLLTHAPVRCARGDLGGGVARAERAIAILSRREAAHPFMQPAKVALGRCLLAGRRAGRAVAVLREARALAGESPARGEASLLLASALWLAGDRAGAVTSAREAHAVLSAQGMALASEAEAWLRQHEARAPGAGR
jgi:tetratricopeptide (TPR) repeat protein